MRNKLARILAAIVAVLAATSSFGQPEFMTGTSLDAGVLNADTVVIGKLVSFTTKDSFIEHELVFAVEQTLKGRTQTTLTLKAFTTPITLEELIARSRRLLICINSTNEAETRWVPIGDPKEAILTADFKILPDAESVIREAKRIIQANPGVNQIDTISADPPRSIVDRIPQAKGYPFSLSVPVDSRVEKRAQEAIRQKDKPNGHYRAYEAIAALAHFKSPENTKLLEGFLADPAWTYSGTDPGSNLGHGKRNYYVREEAHEALKDWGVDVKAPVFEEDVWDPDAVTDVYFNHQVSDEQLRNLQQFKNLKWLAFEKSCVSDGQMKLIAQLPSIRELHPNDNPIGDSGLAEIAGISRLQTLELSRARITDAGVSSLAGLKELKSLDLSWTAITDASMATVAKLTRLEKLSLVGTGSTPAGLYELKPLKSLRHLELWDRPPSGGVTSAFQDVATSFRALRGAGLLHALRAMKGPKGQSRPTRTSSRRGFSWSL